MKKIFILTGEASGDKLASKIIEKIKKSKKDIKFLSVGGSNLANLGIKSIASLYAKDVKIILKPSLYLISLDMQ